MKIIELKGDIYDVLSDGVAGENCIVYHNGTANVFSNMERIYHSQTLQIQSVRRSTHKLYLQRILTLDMEDKTL
jgi:hypothetical protein